MMLTPDDKALVIEAMGKAEREAIAAMLQLMEELAKTQGMEVADDFALLAPFAVALGRVCRVVCIEGAVPVSLAPSVETALLAHFRMGFRDRPRPIEADGTDWCAPMARPAGSA